MHIDGDKTGLQFSLAVNGSTSTTDKAKVESKTRTYGSESDRYYLQVLDSLKTTSSSDSHVKIEIGTEQMLVDFGISGSDSETIDQEEIDWGYMLNSSLTEYQTVFTVAAYSRNAEGHYNVGLVLGGDDPGLTNSGGYSNDEEARYEEHWPSGTYITKETFHNHGGDVESDEPRRHQRTQQYPTQGGNQVSVDFDNPVSTMSMTPPRSLEDILAEYRDRQTQLARLQAELAETTDPNRQTLLQDAIAVQISGLEGLTEEALAAGASQTDLNQITLEAQAAAAADPIDLQTLDNFNDIYIDSAAPGYFYFLTNLSAMDDDLETGFYSSLGVAGGALALAGGLAVFPVISEGLSAFAAAEFILPSFGGGGFALAGGGSTGGVIIGGGTITGSQILTGAGILGGTAVFMEYKDALEAARNAFENNPDFRRYFHRVYKPANKLPSFTRNNPDMGIKHMLDALIEWIELGCPIIKYFTMMTEEVFVRFF